MEQTLPSPEARFAGLIARLCRVIVEQHPDRMWWQLPPPALAMLLYNRLRRLATRFAVVS